MGWSSGSSLVIDMIEIVEEFVPKKNRVEFYRDMIPAFEERDWDNLDEAMGISEYFDKAAKELHPKFFEEDDE